MVRTEHTSCELQQPSRANAPAKEARCVRREATSQRSVECSEPQLEHESHDLLRNERHDGRLWVWAARGAVTTAMHRLVTMKRGLNAARREATTSAEITTRGAWFHVPAYRRSRGSTCSACARGSHQSWRARRTAPTPRRHRRSRRAACSPPGTSKTAGLAFAPVDPNGSATGNAAATAAAAS